MNWMIDISKGMLLLALTTIFPSSDDQTTHLQNQNVINSSQKILKDPAFEHLFDLHLQKNIAQYECPGMAVLVMQEGQVVYEKTFGVKSKFTKESITPESVFRLGSVSKGFAGILASILIDKNIINLEDPLVLYIPELKLKAKTEDQLLRVRHILSQSTGLTEHAYSNLVDENKDLETIITYLNKLTPRDKTGIAYAYQNAAFGLIEKVIESATGMTYAKALDHYLFSPLGMCNTSCTFDGLQSAENVCIGHRYYGPKAGYRPINHLPHYYNVASAGGVNAPLNDMAKWLYAVMGYKPDVISENARNIAFSPYVNTSNQGKYFNHWPGITDSHYALGWRLVNTKNNQLVYHGGLVNGFRAEIAFDKEKNIGVVFLFNSVTNYSNKAVHEFYDLWNSYQATNEKDNFIL
jgi:beta-lactamase class C